MLRHASSWLSIKHYKVDLFKLYLLLFFSFCAYQYRYNEFDQPVCRVCDVVLKSESLWDAHQVSRKHREVIIITISFFFEYLCILVDRTL